MRSRPIANTAGFPAEICHTVRELGIREVVEAMDMDQMTNPNVRKAVLTMRKEVQKIPGIRYAKYTWNPAYKGVDDYLLSRAATM